MGVDQVRPRPLMVVLRWVLPSTVCVGALGLVKLLIELFLDTPRSWLSVVAVSLGLVVGLFFSAVLSWISLRVTVSTTEMTAKGGDARQSFPRTEISAVFVEGGCFVVLGHDSRELFRASSSVRERDLSSAFVRHDYPWRDGDPFIDTYRRWVPDAEELPAGADELLLARVAELKKWDMSAAERSRTRLATLGVIVRDDGHGRQFWRMVE